MMVKTCVTGDLEAFVKICDMGKNLSDPQEPDRLYLNSAVSYDDADILDEIIRTTGLGIDERELEEAEDGIKTWQNSATSTLLT